MRVFLRYLKRDISLAFRTFLGLGDTQSWKRFHKEVRSKGCNLLKMLENFEEPVLVTGCQRSGTTILARVITQSDGMVNYRTRHDDELDAALILSGVEEHVPKGRYCFQTTYLNECYHEYFSKNYDFKLIWVQRNPFSVIRSMKYNWGRFAFNELFEACGYAQLSEEEKQLFRKYGGWTISRTKRACLAYNGKQFQALELIKILGRKRMMVVDYDEMVQKKEIVLPQIYEFVNLPYKDQYGKKIHNKSIGKVARLSKRDKASIESLSIPVYNRLKEIAMHF